MELKINLDKKPLSAQTKSLFMIAGIALIISQVLTLVGAVITTINWGFFPMSFLDVLAVFATIALGVLLLMGMSNIFLAIPLIVMTLLQLISLFQCVGNFFEYFVFRNLISIIGALLELAGVALLLAFSLGFTIKHTLFDMVSKFWFLPGLLVLVPNIISSLTNIVSSIVNLFDYYYYNGGFLIFREFIYALAAIIWGVAAVLVGRCLADCLAGKAVANDIFASIPTINSRPSAPTYTPEVSPQPQPAPETAPAPQSETQPKQPTSTESLSEELSKYKSLYEQGLITEAEFAAKKKQLLNL